MKAGRIWLWSRAVIGWSMSSRMMAQETPERYATACHLQKRQIDILQFES
ncbi:Uncharacterised protein [Escherichia coli]|nr:Uncharacterised protein [Escherichia coli]VTR32332.1 Uncharacterised protein [Escherichia coli]